MEAFWRTPAEESFGSFGGIWANEHSAWKASLQVNVPDPWGLYWGQALLSDVTDVQRILSKP